eukprot:TRINITY_DN13357_c0_g1_i1.p1 TRINITY_DN13357_c0_g1~~TRINITY_DN13357_c0_g1_i1.p1  ORF type:complete len:165 (+),score=24.00 TRINITY_DN13357_c0_g1_i1:85-579(+)
MAKVFEDKNAFYLRLDNNKLIEFDHKKCGKYPLNNLMLKMIRREKVYIKNEFYINNEELDPFTIVRKIPNHSIIDVTSLEIKEGELVITTLRYGQFYEYFIIQASLDDTTQKIKDLIIEKVPHLEAHFQLYFNSELSDPSEILRERELKDNSLDPPFIYFSHPY